MRQNHQSSFYLLALCLFAIFITVSSCQKRYGYVQKVRVGKSKTKVVTTRHTKNALILSPILQQKSIAKIEQQQTEEFAITPKQQLIALPIAHSTLKTLPTPPIRKAIAPTDSFVRDGIAKPIPKVEEIKLQVGNVEQMLYLAVAIIFGLILLYIIGVGVVFVSQIISPVLFPFFYHDILAVLSIIGSLLFLPTYKLFRKFIRKTLKTPVTYGKHQYYLGDFKHMSRQAQLKNTFHNLLAMVLFGFPLVLLSYIVPLLFAVVLAFIFILIPYYFLKLLTLLFFSRR